MTDPDNARAIAALERKIMDAKREARDYKSRGLAVPEWLQIKITKLSNAAFSLRDIPGGKESS